MIRPVARLAFLATLAALPSLLPATAPAQPCTAGTRVLSLSFAAPLQAAAVRTALSGDLRLDGIAIGAREIEVRVSAPDGHRCVARLADPALHDAAPRGRWLALASPGDDRCRAVSDLLLGAMDDALEGSPWIECPSHGTGRVTRARPAEPGSLRAFSLAVGALGLLLGGAGLAVAVFLSLGRNQE